MIIKPKVIIELKSKYNKNKHESKSMDYIKIQS